MGRGNKHLIWRQRESEERDVSSQFLYPPPLLSHPSLLFRCDLGRSLVSKLSAKNGFWFSNICTISLLLKVGRGPINNPDKFPIIRRDSERQCNEWLQTTFVLRCHETYFWFEKAGCLILQNKILVDLAECLMLSKETQWNLPSLGRQCHQGSQLCLRKKFAKNLLEFDSSYNMFQLCLRQIFGEHFTRVSQLIMFQLCLRQIFGQNFTWVSQLIAYSWQMTADSW